MNLQNNKVSPIDLDNTLTGIFSVIPFPHKTGPKKSNKEI